MDTTKHQDFDRSQLFLVRVWNDTGSGEGHAEWQGRVQHVVSGEAHSFGDWQTLITLFLSRLSTRDVGTDGVLEIGPESR